MKKLLNYILFKMGYTSIDQSDLRHLTNNSTEDLTALEMAVLRDLSRLKCFPPEALNEDEKQRMQSLYAWRIMIIGCKMDAQNRESQQWVDKQMKEINHGTFYPSRIN